MLYTVEPRCKAGVCFRAFPALQRVPPYINTKTKRLSARGTYSFKSKTSIGWHELLFFGSFCLKLLFQSFSIECQHLWWCSVWSHQHLGSQGFLFCQQATKRISAFLRTFSVRDWLPTDWVRQMRVTSVQSLIVNEPYSLPATTPSLPPTPQDCPARRQGGVQSCAVHSCLLNAS